MEQNIGFFRLKDQPIVINAGRKSTQVTVKNGGNRTIQVGSHFHFFEVNKDLAFDREKTLGMHLDIPSGMSVRFSPGQTLTVTVVEYGGRQEIWGFAGLTNGCVQDPSVRAAALKNAREQGFIREAQNE